MTTALIVVLTLIGLVGYIFLSMLIYAWCIETMLDWMRDHGVDPKYGLIALYRVSEEDPHGEEGLASAVGPGWPVLLPLALLEFVIRLLARKIRPPQLNVFLA